MGLVFRNFGISVRIVGPTAEQQRTHTLAVMAASLYGSYLNAEEMEESDDDRIERSIQRSEQILAEAEKRKESPETAPEA